MEFFTKAQLHEMIKENIEWIKEIEEHIPANIWEVYSWKTALDRIFTDYPKYKIGTINKYYDKEQMIRDLRRLQGLRVQTLANIQGK